MPDVGRVRLELAELRPTPAAALVTVIFAVRRLGVTLRQLVGRCRYG